MDEIDTLKKNVSDALEALIEALIEGVVNELLDDTDEPPAPDPDPDPDTHSGDTNALIIMKHHGQPDLSQFGLTDVKMHYESSVTAGGNPSKEKLQAAAQASKGRVILDIESWADSKNEKGGGFWRVDDEGVRKYIQALTWYREAMPAGHQVALYSILPARNLWDAVADRDSDRFKRWQSWNDEIAPIAPHVDLIFPSCYTFNSNRYQWPIYARAQIDEARRIGGGKPVYPVLWPQYHPGKGPIEGDFWRIQLQTCVDHADGFLIWDDRREDRTDFNRLADWWDVTVDFLK